MVDAFFPNHVTLVVLFSFFLPQDFLILKLATALEPIVVLLLVPISLAEFTIIKILPVLKDLANAFSSLLLILGGRPALHLQ